MKLYRILILNGLFNILSYIMTEIMLVGNFDYDIYSFNMLSALGIIIALLNLGGLYYAYQNQMNNVVIWALLFAIAYGIYQTFSISAIGFRAFMIIDGVVLCYYSKKKMNG